MSLATSRTITKVTAFASAALLALSMLALALVQAEASGTQFVPASHGATEDHGPPNDPPCERGKAGEKNPNCDNDRERGKDKDKEKDKDKDKGPKSCDEGEKWKGGECVPDDSGPSEQEQCEADGGTWEDGECVPDDSGPSEQEQCEADGGTWEDGECVPDDNGGTQPAGYCPPPSGAFELHVPASPLADICVVLAPDEETANDLCPPPSGALEIEVPAAPLAWACVVLGPDDADGDENGADDEDNGPTGTPLDEILGQIPSL